MFYFSIYNDLLSLIISPRFLVHIILNNYIAHVNTVDIYIYIYSKTLYASREEEEEEYSDRSPYRRSYG